MAYVRPDYPTKKAFKAAVLRGVLLRPYSPGPYGVPEAASGHVTIEGPHYPKAHSWYARCDVDLDTGYITKVT